MIGDTFALGEGEDDGDGELERVEVNEDGVEEGVGPLMLSPTSEGGRCNCIC